jgi:pimeloyl-ACP methyl ester carboxylesterase
MGYYRDSGRYGSAELAELPQHYREVLVDGKRLETLLLSSPAKAPTIVMLHEGLGSIAMWKDFPEQLAHATGCGVLVYSRYGHGRSERLAEKRSIDFMHHEAMVVLPELLRQFRIHQPIVLGHSDGASIALIFAGSGAGSWAGAEPRQVRALVLEAPHVFVEDLSVQSIANMRTLFESTDLPQKLARYHDHVEETFRGWNNIWLAPDFRKWNIEEYLSPITCPVLVVQGENDEYGTLAQVQAIQRRIPKTQTLILPRCGHSPHRDHPAATLVAVAKFVKGLP